MGSTSFANNHIKILVFGEHVNHKSLINFMVSILLKILMGNFMVCMI